MQQAASQVTVYEQRAVAAVREGERKVRGEERLPIARARARDRDEQRPRGGHQIEAQPAQGFDHLGGLSRILQVRHGAQDRESEFVRHLLRVADARVNAIEHDRADHREPEAPTEGQKNQARRGILHRPPRYHGRIQDPQVGYDRSLGHLGFLVAPL